MDNKKTNSLEKRKIKLSLKRESKIPSDWIKKIKSVPLMNNLWINNNVDFGSDMTITLDNIKDNS